MTFDHFTSRPNAFHDHSFSVMSSIQQSLLKHSLIINIPLSTMSGSDKKHVLDTDLEQVAAPMLLPIEAEEQQAHCSHTVVVLHQNLS